MNLIRGSLEHFQEFFRAGSLSLSHPFRNKRGMDGALKVYSKTKIV
jgi:hypothetical protein